MADKAWKRQERKVAELLGSRRNPNTGENRTDIDTPAFAIEHKARRRLPQWLTDALRQARDGANGRIPIVVLSEVSQGVKARRYVLLALEDWLDWHGPVTGEKSPVKDASDSTISHKPEVCKS